MPSLAENLEHWGSSFDWSRGGGNEWSGGWGGPSFEWWTTLFPRLQGYVPASRMLEIAPGAGRWTHFLRELCDELTIVDIAPKVIQTCRERFEDDSRISAHVGDGSSLPMCSEGSIDLVFSFDSLVHVDLAVLGPYMAEFSRILTPDGVTFIHHSNMGMYGPETENPAWRDRQISRLVVERLAAANGLRCISQETLAWNNQTILSDCISVIVRQGSRWDRENVIADNIDFTRGETAMARKFSELYPAWNDNARMRVWNPYLLHPEHDRALKLLRSGDPDQGYRLLGTHVARELDPDLLSDLATLATASGQTTEAQAILTVLAALHPEYGDGAPTA